MDSLRIITVESSESSPKEEGSIAINSGLPENPILEIYRNGNWTPLDNLESIDRMSKLDDLYTHLYRRNWGIGPRFSEISGDLYIHTNLYRSPVPVLSDGIKVSEHITSDEITDDMNKEIDIYYNSLVSSRNFLERSSVVDLWEYPTEYGGTLNLVTLPAKSKAPIIKLGVSWVNKKLRKTENICFTPWNLGENGFEWSDFQSFLGEDEVIVEFHGGCIRVFPNSQEVTECIIHHCQATYDGLL